MKHEGGNIIVWGHFSSFEIGLLYKNICGKMDSFEYQNILKNVMLPYAKLEMPVNFVFQHDNDPKHTAIVVSAHLDPIESNGHCTKY